MFKTNAHEANAAAKEARAEEVVEQKVRIEAGKIRAAELLEKKKAELEELEAKRQEKLAAKEAARKIYEEKNPKQIIGNRRID